MDHIRQYRSQEDEEEEDYFEDEDDAWCHEIELPPAKRCRVDENLMDDDEDEWCHDNDLQPTSSQPSAENIQIGGGVTSPLFTFDVRPSAMPQRWKNIFHKTRHSARLQQSREPEVGDNLGSEMTDAVRRALLSTISLHPNLGDQDRIHFTMQTKALSEGNNHCFQSTRFTVAEVRDGGERLTTYLQQLARQLNSGQSFSPGDEFTLDTTTIVMPERGSRPKKYDPIKAAVRGIVKGSRISIKKKDDLCCARAIVTMRAWANEQSQRFSPIGFNTLRKGKPSQKRLALELLQTAGVAPGPCGLPELVQLQAAMPEYQIKVMKVGRPHMVMFVGHTPSPTHRRILLILEDGHFDGCTSFAAFFNTVYFCHDCDRGYNTEDMKNHPCDRRWCHGCLERDCDEFVSAKSLLPPRDYPVPSHICPDCHRGFFGANCLLRHTQKGLGQQSTCEKQKKCPSCCKSYEIKYRKGQATGHRHKCGWADCHICEKWVDIYTHQCFIQPVKPKEDDPKTKKVPTSAVGNRTVVEGDDDDEDDDRVRVERDPPLMVYADYEAMTDASGVQFPILIGYETAESNTCHLLYGSDCTTRFFADLEALAVDQDGDDRNVIILFHNLKGYDAMFLLQHAYTTHRDVSHLVTVGVKVLSFCSDRLTFKDSLCFLPFSLASFPATFGLTELCKGYFPHKFNTSDNQGYEGLLPDMSFYDPDGMSLKKKTEFQQWHVSLTASGYTFHLIRDMKKYCESDVKLLKAGCQKFVAEFKTEAGFDPLEKCITIASACNRYWRKHHLTPPRMVAVQPPNGWKGCQTNQSFQAHQWLSWFNHRLRADTTSPDRIRHVYNGGEVRLEGELVDGYDATTRTVYEYNGCFFHGCPLCFPKTRLSSVSRLRSDRTMQECFEATLTKRRKLESAGYTVVTKWECQWLRDMKDNETIRSFVDRHLPISPLEPRDAFFGGRTNAVKLHHSVIEGETIRYQDVTSLYPWVNKYKEFPTGHPHIITGIEHTDMSEYFGVAKITIIPPFGLFHPVLPLRSGGKLTFPLCRTCVEMEMVKPLLERSCICHHTDEERALTGTWCTPEIMEAVSQRYTIVKIHEVWHFSHQSTSLFLVRQYLASHQDGSQWVSSLGHDSRRKTALSRKLSPSRRHCIGSIPHRKESRKKSHRQTHAELVLGQVW